MVTRIYFHTNLDEAQHDVQGLNQFGQWPFGVPRVGEEVSFDFRRDDKTFTYRLRVVAVRYDVAGKLVHVELHMPEHPHRSIAEWTEWFRRHRLGKEW